ncbi:MAG TPA: DUF1080 domain-containing protein [Cyclobacteriaceae bacterium]|nr:DUF1080 domain-containing protein [Cyclobacteriaceae bacterium]
MRTLILSLIFSAIFIQTIAQEAKTKSIFNGKNFKGWVLPEDNIWWSIEDGNLWAKSDPAKKGSILWTKKSYGDFVLEGDFLMGEGVVDSGFFLRSEKDQIQIGISGSLKRDMTASPYIPGKGYPIEADGVETLLKQNDWNTMKIQLVDQTYKVWLNGQEVMTYTSENMPEKGPIGLQLHPNNDMTVAFRNLRIEKL